MPERGAGLVANQDGSGAWTQVQPVNATFTFPINSGSGGVATYSRSNLQIFYGTQQAPGLYGTQCRTTPAPTKTVKGSVAGLQPTDSAFVSLGGAVALRTGLGGRGYTLTGVRDGPQDLVASRSTINISGSVISGLDVSTVNSTPYGRLRAQYDVQSE
jgi:hypothetical protein